MLRVFDLDKSLDFYTRLMGMKLLRKRETAEGRYTLAFVGYGGEEDCNRPRTHLQLGPEGALRHRHRLRASRRLGPDIYKVCERLAKEGVKITRPPGPLKFGTAHIAFIEDPDGYKIELIQRP